MLNMIVKQYECNLKTIYPSNYRNVDSNLYFGSSGKRVGHFAGNSYSREHASENFEFQVFLIPDPVRPALDDANLVVQALDESERDLVLRLAESGNPIPMTLDHLGKLIKRLQSLPLERRSPVIEEATGIGFPLVVPQLPKGFFKQVSRIQPLVA